MATRRHIKSSDLFHGTQVHYHTKRLADLCNRTLLKVFRGGQTDRRTDRRSKWRQYPSAPLADKGKNDKFPRIKSATDGLITAALRATILKRLGLETSFGKRSFARFQWSEDGFRRKNLIFKQQQFFYNYAIRSIHGCFHLRSTALPLLMPQDKTRPGQARPIVGYNQQKH